VRHHFLRDHIAKDIVLDFVGIEHQLANILTKLLSKDHKIKGNLGFIHAKDI